MKQFKAFLLLLCAVISLFAISCNDSSKSSNTTSETTTVVDTSQNDTNSARAAESTESNISRNPENIVIARYKVSDYSKWRTQYDSRDSVRTANGLRNYILGRGVKDSNEVMVAVKAADITKAKALTSDPSFLAAMRKGYVTGTPKFTFLKVMYQDMSASMPDLRSMNFLTVKDWDNWVKVFEEGKSIRAANGLMERAYGHDVDDNHKVVVVVGITDSAKATAHWKSDLMKQKQQESGVVGDIERFVYRVVQKY